MVSLRAVNDQGAGPDVHQGTMPFAGAPGPPGDFRATLISENEFRLSWTEPAAAPGVTITGYIIDQSPDGVTDWGQRTYDIAVPGTTSMTGQVGLRTGYFRIKTQFQMDTPTVVDGIEFSWGMSETSPIVGLGTGEASVDPTLPQIRVWDASAREGRDLAVDFTVRLHPASTSTVTVDYRTEDVRATAPDDYEATSGTLTFAPGETERTVSVPIVDDDVEDSGEEFALLLSNVSGTRLGDEGAAGVIFNEEDVLAGFTLVDASSGTDVGSLADGTEVTLDDPANGSFGIVARAAPDVEIGSVRLELTGAKAVAHTDDAAPYSLYGDAGGTVRGEALPAGSYTLSATAYAEANGGGEALETRTVSFTVTAGDATDPVAGSSELSVADAETSEEEDTALEFVVTLAPAAGGTVTVDYATADGTATAGDDYDSTSGTLTFEAGDTTKTVSVPIADDTEDDGGETLTLTLGNASGAVVGDAVATGTIRDTEASTDPLTASFENVPAEHDGQSAFSFRVEFSEDVGTSYKTLRDESFSVREGDLTGARRVDGRHDLWEITVEPDSREAVTISLPGGRACGTAGAVCTRGGDPRALSNGPSATVAGPPSEPLTASFSGMPAEHAGEGTFTFGLTFSENVELSYVTLRDAAFSVSGGAVRKAKRRQQGSNVAWEITVEPDSAGAVTIGLPQTTDCDAGSAICTADGRPLSHALSATVAGPVGISVADARVDENAGAPLAFAVTLSRAASGTVTVGYATADGSAQAGVDYTAASGTLTFQAGESSRTIEVTVLDDSHDEGEETLTLNLSSAAGGRLTDAEATGTIVNTDPLPRALLARFGRTAAVHVVEHVEERLQAPRKPGFEGRFAGRALRRGMERDVALRFLKRLGVSGGAYPAAGGLHDPRSGSGALAMPGLSGAAAPMGGMGGPPMGGAAGSMGGLASPMGGAAGRRGLWAPWAGRGRWVRRPGRTAKGTG